MESGYMWLILKVKVNWYNSFSLTWIKSEDISKMKIMKAIITSKNIHISFINNWKIIQKEI